MSFRRIIFWLLLLICFILIIYLLFRKENSTVDGHDNIFVQYPGNIQDYFSSIANNLNRELRENPEQWADKKDRVARAIELLSNGVFDPNVILLQSRISSIADSNNVCLTIIYLDESDLVESICYNVFPNQTVGTLLLSMSDTTEHKKEFRFQRGYMCWIIPLISDEYTPREKAFHKLVKEEWYLVINSEVYNSICSRKGKIVLLNSSEKILDQMEIKK